MKGIIQSKHNYLKEYENEAKRQFDSNVLRIFSWKQKCTCLRRPKTYGLQ